MQKGLGRAVFDLRDRMEWTQDDLAQEMCKIANRWGFEIRPNRICILRWENMEAAPSSEHRIVLARIAERSERTADLVEVFRAPVSAWRLVGRLRDEP